MIMFVLPVTCSCYLLHVRVTCYMFVFPVTCSFYLLHVRFTCYTFPFTLESLTEKLKQRTEEISSLIKKEKEYLRQIEKIEDDYRKKELDLLNDLDISQDKNEASITREHLTVHGPCVFFNSANGMDFERQTFIWMVVYCLTGLKQN